MKERSLSPICLFTYNRVGETKKTLEALANNHLASFSDLFIFSDGPKSNNDIVNINLIRDFIKSISGFKSISLIESQYNKGLANSIITGVNKMFENFDKVIVLEDDLITSPNFLQFMNQALDFYSDDSSVISISGYTLDLPSLPGRNDYYFGYRASSWGWGTWKSRWDKIDWEMKTYDYFMNNKQCKRNLLRGGSDMVRMLRNQKQGKIDSWAIRFCYHQSLNEQITVFPTTSKVQSIGFSKEATHTAGVKRFFTKLDSGEQLEFNFKKFSMIDEKIVKEFRDKFSIMSRIRDKVNVLFSK